MARQWAVSTGHPLSSGAAAKILEQGGNAVDAAIAANAAIAGRPASYLARQLYDMQVGARHGEWAALMNEAGAAAIHVSHRHDSPAFAESDWSWVNPLVDRFATDPGWYRRLTQSAKDELGRRLWAEGRLKLEPWLASRVRAPNIHLWPNTQVAGFRDLPGGGFAITLAGRDGARVVDVDRIVLATGYKVDVNRVPLVARGNILPQLQTDNDAPVLDDCLQTSIAGLFMTSMLATRSFGPFFAFTVSARASATLIGQAIAPARA
jgi:hypothetical protein